MRILVVADGRSPITRSWVEDLVNSGHDVVLVSTFPHGLLPGVEAQYVLPICFSRFAGSQVQNPEAGVRKESSRSVLRGLIRKYRNAFQHLRYWLGPVTFPIYRPRLKKILGQHAFDLVHILRIPFEGLFAMPVMKGLPTVVSIWGNDLTLHAPKNGYMRRNTRKVLERADGLIVDVKRDIALAQQWGYSTRKPVMVALTSGGIDAKAMHSVLEGYSPEGFQLPEGNIVTNPRGIRPGYVRNDTFFAAIPKVLMAMDAPVHFLCPSMAGQPEAEQWVQQYGLEENVLLLPYLSQKDLWYIFSHTQVFVSPSTHDGTPNSLLEAMAMGAIPVVGNIASLQEWVEDGKNGCLIDPSSPEEFAAAIVFVLKNEDLAARMRAFNQSLAEEKASKQSVRTQRDAFYNQILNHPMS